MTKNKKIGIILLVSPWIIGLFLMVGSVFMELRQESLLLRYPSSTTTASGDILISEYASPELDRFYLMRNILEYIKIGNFLYFFVGTGLGIYFLVKRDEIKNPASQVPEMTVK